LFKEKHMFTTWSFVISYLIVKCCLRYIVTCIFHLFAQWQLLLKFHLLRRAMLLFDTQEWRAKKKFSSIVFVLVSFLLPENTRFGNCITPETPLATGLFRGTSDGSFENFGIAISMRTATASETLDSIVNALHHVRKYIIKFSTTEAKESKEKLPENANPGRFDKIFKRMKIFRYMSLAGYGTRTHMAENSFSDLFQQPCASIDCKTQII